MNGALPPGPSSSRLLQTVRWMYRPAAMLEDCRRRYGDMFTLRIAHEGTWVFLAHPDAIKQVFTGDPRLLHAGEANIVLLPMLGHHSVLLLDETAHMSQRKPLPRRQLRVVRDEGGAARGRHPARAAGARSAAGADHPARDHAGARARRRGRSRAITSPPRVQQGPCRQPG
jgi:hypothetical protein